MCGIVAYIGTRAAAPIVLEGLRQLEYRGYDSAGIAVFENGSVRRTRAEGKLSNLKDRLRGLERPSEGAAIGIGHTRWATHGRPSDENAHPHQAGRVCLVHNGIIENYVELRTELGQAGAEFSS